MDPRRRRKWADVVMMLVPDELAPEINERDNRAGAQGRNYFLRRARLRTPLQEDRAADGRGCVPSGP